MPLFYAIKRVLRSWKLFLALLIGITLASTFFAGIDVKANATARQALDQKLSSIYVDMEVNPYSIDSALLVKAREKVLTVDGVNDAEVLSRSFVQILLPNENWSIGLWQSYPGYVYGSVVGLSNNSQVYDGWTNKPVHGIGENEAYLPVESPYGNMVKIGDVMMANFTFYNYTSQRNTFYSFNLTVKGFAELDDRAFSIASGYRIWINPLIGAAQSTDRKYATDFLLVSWEKTMQKIIAATRGQDSSHYINIYLNRDALLSPWDAQTSLANVERVKNNIENTIATETGWSVSVQNNLEWPLRSFLSDSTMISFMFTIVSLPIFFMAWYMGTTVSDVSFNLRRREIGLLSTKGFSKSQILRIFLTETIMIGLIGGLLGVLLGFLLAPLFSQVSTGVLFDLRTISPYTLAFTVVFGVVMALLSTFNSARKVSRLPTVDALREYLPMEAEKAYKKKWPWAAFILGTYKIIVFILGINVIVVVSSIIFQGGNFVLILLAGLWIVIDQILNYIGPLLFFWGFTKLFIQGSLKFQELTSRAAKFLGDLGALATKNVRRNPARSAAMAFLIALIVGYSVQVTGQLASEQDYAIRRVYNQVGADISTTVVNTTEAPQIMNAIMANASDSIQNATIVYSFSVYSNNGMSIKAVEPLSWLKAAYYENDWFSGTPVETAMDELASSNNTIILERLFAKNLGLKVGDSIFISFGTVGKSLRTVGFFGPEPPEQQTGIYYQVTQYWSFIPLTLYKEISNQVTANSQILVKLKSGVDGKNVAETIRNLDLNVGQVSSFAEDWENAQTDVMSMGVLDVQRLGVFFAVLAASVGTALISSVSLKERSREATIMSVRGLSFKQLVIMFLTENLAIVVFSVILGVFVGFVIAYGNISSSNAMVFDLIRRRLVLSLDAALTLTACITLIFASTILPIVIMSRRYVTKLERMVRLR
jgi:ABC-type lipoprotein release transport system permease subunit